MSGCRQTITNVFGQSFWILPKFLTYHIWYKRFESKKLASPNGISPNLRQSELRLESVRDRDPSMYESDSKVQESYFKIRIRLGL
jgi:hypothetical protein